MTAIDINTGEHLWWIPTGIGPESVRGHPSLQGLDLPPLGGQGRGGPLVTKTLLIHALSANGDLPARLAAYDKTTGEKVGEVALPDELIGTPMTYMVNGVQYIATTVGRGKNARLIALRLA